MRLSPLLLIAIAVASVQLIAGEQGVKDQLKTRTVSTLLNAKWNATPLALEIAEFLSDEDPSYFWSFIEDLAANHDTLSKSTSSQMFCWSTS